MSISRDCEDCKYEDTKAVDYPFNNCIHLIDPLSDNFEPKKEELAVCGSNQTRADCACQECFIP